MTTIETLYQHFLACSGVTTDSRNCPADSLFIALKGASFNGNAFAAKALEQGCRYAVIDEPAYQLEWDERYLLVEDGLTALQQLAHYHRQQFQIPVIAITGTNGKTTTKELVAAVLSSRRPILYTQGNLNNAIGVPLTLLRLTSAHQLAIIEMGASHPGDIKELVDIANPTHGLITNVGKAHLQGFGSFEGVIHTKGELYDYLRSQGDREIFIDRDNPYLTKIANSLRWIGYSREGGEGCKRCGKQDVIGEVTGNSPYLTLRWRTAESDRWHEIETQLIGEYNFCNVMAAVAVGHYFGYSEEDICNALTHYTPTNNRSQLMQTGRNTLIIDAYNANPTSMMAALNNFKTMQAERKLLILGDMRELGAESAVEHQRIADYLTACGFEQVMLVGQEFAAAHHTYPTYPDVDAAIEALKEQQPEGQTILIKGSNGIHLNRVIEFL